MTKRSEDVWSAVGDEVRTYRGTLLTVNEWLTDEEAEEVARIAAAAPQMLRALEKAKEIIRVWHGPNAWYIYERSSPEMQEINSAIKKAKGEEDE